MKIAVCVKEVLDTAAKVRIAADGRTVDPSGVEFVVNPYEEYALEEAVRIKESLPGTEVTVVTLGPSRAASTIMKALAMGLDRAVHLKSEDFPSDPYAVANALASELKGGGYDVILFGKKAVDDDAQQVGPMVAEILGLPCVSSIVKLELLDGRARVHQEVEGGIIVAGTPLPAVFTAEKGLNEPRYVSLRELMLSKRKPIEVREPVRSEARLETLSLNYPPPRPPGRIVGRGVEAVPELVRLLREEAKVL